jgi:hypothetical protein
MATKVLPNSLPSPITPAEARKRLNKRHRLTIGQYLKPDKNSLNGVEFITSDKFDAWANTAKELGFTWVQHPQFLLRRKGIVSEFSCILVFLRSYIPASLFLSDLPIFRPATTFNCYLLVWQGANFGEIKE